MVGERWTVSAEPYPANCRHSFGPYYEGQENPYKDIMTADNVRMEKLEQRQRALERRVRKTKREVMGLQEAVEKCQDEAAKFELQQALDRKSYLDRKSVV